MRALVVGAGRMGGFHRKVLADLGLDVTTVDPDPNAGADYLRVPSRDYEVVCVATPIEQLVEEAFRWCGHEGYLLIEKPLAPSLKVAKQMACLLTGQRVAVGYVERFNPRVRALKRLLDDSPPPYSARFTRHNDRPSPDVPLDLRSHDVDLAAWLGCTERVTYDTSDCAPERRRTIQIQPGPEGLSLAVDLTAHDTSPLHAMWHAFLSGQQGYATPVDAARVLAELGAREAVPA